MSRHGSVVSSGISMQLEFVELQAPSSKVIHTCPINYNHKDHLSSLSALHGIKQIAHIAGTYGNYLIAP